MYELSEEIKLDKNIKHNIEIVVDRLVVKEGIEQRLTDSIENVLNLAEGLMTVDVIGGEPVQFSESFSCPDCGISIEEIEPRSFSFHEAEHREFLSDSLQMECPAKNRILCLMHPKLHK